MWTQIVVAMVTTSLFLAVEHLFPWRGLLGRELRLIERYVAGMLAVLVPVSVLLAVWGSWMELAALWVVTIQGGLVVISLYGVDGHISQKQRMEAAEAAERMLRDGAFE